MTSNNQSSSIDNVTHPLVMRDLDRFVKITEAARILGYASFQSVKQLVDQKILTSYSLPGTSRPRLLLSELVALKVRNQSNMANFIPIRITGKRGRRKKYENC
jgi:hypothetical protein